MNQNEPQPWWGEYVKTMYLSSPSYGEVEEKIVAVGDIPAIIAEAERRGQVKAWEEVEKLADLIREENGERAKQDSGEPSLRAELIGEGREFAASRFARLSHSKIASLTKEEKRYESKKS